MSVAEPNTPSSFGDMLGAEAFDRQKNKAERKVEDFELEGFEDFMPIIKQTQLIGGAMITIAIIGIVLNEFLTLDMIANGSGPMAGVFTSLENVGVAALTLLVIGLLVVAANGIMGFFGGGF
jgi:hypothetical protein